MNSGLAFKQAEIFPFGFGKSISEVQRFKRTKYPKVQKNYIPEQKKELHKLEETHFEKIDKVYLSEEVINIIGENGKNRFDEFITYPKGWYGGKGEKWSKGSVFFLEQFANYLPELKFYKPSLFMTLEGNFSLGFEDKQGKSIEIEFFSDRAEYYLESLEEESNTKLADIFNLVNKVRNLLK